MNSQNRTTLVLAGVALAAAALVVTSPPTNPAGRPDWTVASCDLWANTSTPDLPAYTMDGFCVSSGVLSKAPGTDLDCNNDSYNTGGPELTIPRNLYKLLCK